MKITPVFLSGLSFLCIVGASQPERKLTSPVIPSKEHPLEESAITTTSQSSSVLWIRPTTTILDTDSNRYQSDYTRVLSISRGGGWLSDAAKDVEGSASSAKAKAKQALASASSKTTDVVTKAKSTAEQGWLKRVEDLEQRLRDEKVKASKRLESEQKRLNDNAKKQQVKLESKIKELERKLNEQRKRK